MYKGDRSSNSMLSMKNLIVKVEYSKFTLIKLLVGSILSCSFPIFPADTCLAFH